MDLSTLNSIQQVILFALLILGHAFPISGFISLLRALSFRSALNNTPDKEKGDQTVSRIPTLQIEKQIAFYKEGALPATVIGKAKIRTAVREVQANRGLWNGYEFCVATDPRHPDESQRAPSIAVNNNEKDVGNWKAHISSLISWLKSMVQRAANHMSCRDSINCNAPGGINYMALSLIAGLVILYFIGFLILGIVSVGLWSKFVRPDIPRGG